MITIKINCECGQRYAFDVEPVDSCLPVAVACPTCGTDGTAAANAVIAQSIPQPPPAAAAAPARAVPLRVTAAAAAVHADAQAASPSVDASRKAGRLLPGQIDPVQAEHEARAKIMWGDSTEAVIKFLLIQGFTREEAANLVGAMFRKRAITIRRNGIRKMVIGSVLICVPIAAWIFFASMRILPIKLFALTVMVGVWGGCMLFNGTFMFATPKSTPGDVSEH